MSRSRAVRAPRQKTASELQEVLHPRFNDVTFVDYTLTEATNNSHASVTEGNNQPKVYEPDTSKLARNSIEADKFVPTESEKKLTTFDVTDENDVRVKPDKFVIDTIVSQNINRSRSSCAHQVR